jgi:serine/threonine-protein kinase HipA
MRKVSVFRNSIFAGVLTEENRHSYVFRYDASYYANAALPAVSLTLPKTSPEYRSDHLFPCFFNLLSEGVNRALQSQRLRLDENDHVGFLLATGGSDTLGALTFKPLNKPLP